jgi:histidinol-phosphate aminotransferase
VRALSSQFREYAWAPSTAGIARLAGIAPEDVLRFDGNTPPRPRPSSTVAAIADDLARINSYRHGGFPELDEAIARYAGVEPENVVVGAGADDLIMLVARSFAGAGDVVAVTDEPSYPILRISAWIAGADVGHDDPVLTFCCRPHNPTGALVPIPAARPLAVDEAYFEFSGGETAVGLIGGGDVVVIRTFSKAFGLASARIGYALARADLADELRLRQSPAPVSTLSIALALAGLADPPDVSETVAERERLAAELRSAGLEVPASYGNFVFVPSEEPRPLYDGLLRQGLAVRPAKNGLRITVRDPGDDDLLVDRLVALLG